MDCEKYKSWISRYVDNELSQEEVLILKKHIQSCLRCEEFLKDLNVMRDLFAAEKAPEPSSELQSRVTKAARNHNLLRTGLAIREVARRLCMAAAFLAAITLGLFYFGSSDPLQAVDKDKEIHYEDLLQSASSQEQDSDVLEALFRTTNPREALRIYKNKRER